ncbi:unnamed protein product [Pocillopora meandrina]|uniref:Uncharacterized protein n=1 Tax=Pocillopora meandrina TaxID=46732 RepID=A0AAU9WC45_9CNID|nr:unnamed protein product [Pocillopora meandrina]
MSRVSVEQSFSYQSLFEVVRQEDFLAIFENAALDLQILIYAISKDLHRRFESVVFMSWLLQCNRFPYNEQITNEWFPYHILGESGQNVINTLNVSLNEEERKDWQNGKTSWRKKLDFQTLTVHRFFMVLTTNLRSASCRRESISLTADNDSTSVMGKDFISRTISLKVFNMLNLLDLAVLRTTLIWEQQF